MTKHLKVKHFSDSEKSLDEHIPYRGVELYETNNSPQVSYERKHSHTHCWDNPDSPCGIPLEKHTQCCLCDMQYAQGSGGINTHSPQVEEKYCGWCDQKGHIRGCPDNSQVEEWEKEFDEKFVVSLYSLRGSEFYRKYGENNSVNKVVVEFEPTMKQFIKDLLLKDREKQRVEMVERIEELEVLWLTRTSDGDSVFSKSGINKSQVLNILLTK